MNFEIIIIEYRIKEKLFELIINEIKYQRYII